MMRTWHQFSAQSTTLTQTCLSVYESNVCVCARVRERESLSLHLPVMVHVCVCVCVLALVLFLQLLNWQEDNSRHDATGS